MRQEGVLLSPDGREEGHVAGGMHTSSVVPVRVALSLTVLASAVFSRYITDAFTVSSHPFEDQHSTIKCNTTQCNTMQYDAHMLHSTPEGVSG